jgi:hypothetical protein
MDAVAFIVVVAVFRLPPVYQVNESANFHRLKEEAVGFDPNLGCSSSCDRSSNSCGDRLQFTK